MNRKHASRVDALYRLPPEEFTAARNALVAELRAAGQGDKAGEVRKLARPALSVWAVNHLWWEHRKDFDALLRAGKRLRALQREAAGGAAAERIRRAAGDLRGALTTLTGHAESALAARGSAPGRALMKRIETTLDALAGLAETPPDQRPGRLTRDLDPPGFDALLALSAAAAGPAPRAKPDRALAGAREASTRAERAAVRAREAADKAEREHAAAVEALEQIVTAERELRRRLESTRRRLAEARRKRDRTRVAARKAAAARAAAEKEQRRARKALERRQG